MTRYRYQLGKDNAISFYDDENPIEDGSPFFYQPDWPNGAKWASKAEAEAWAKAFIAELQDPKSEFVAGDSPDQPLKPRPIIQPEVIEPEVTE